ncbi:MAG: hypothetical protein ACRCXB_20135 [Aeromonadaceae bacterium]
MTFEPDVRPAAPQKAGFSEHPSICFTLFNGTLGKSFRKFFASFLTGGKNCLCAASSQDDLQLSTTTRHALALFVDPVGRILWIRDR